MSQTYKSTVIYSTSLFNSKYVCGAVWRFAGSFDISSHRFDNHLIDMQWNSFYYIRTRSISFRFHTFSLVRDSLLIFNSV